jgi:phosphoribosyl-AMP cyclohydrolase
MRPIGCPETSVRNYHYSLRNNPEERSSQLLRGRSLTSCTSQCVFHHHDIAFCYAGKRHGVKSGSAVITQCTVGLSCDHTVYSRAQLWSHGVQSGSIVITRCTVRLSCDHTVYSRDQLWSHGVQSGSAVITRCTVGLSCDQMKTKHTDDEYGDTL